MAFDIFRKISYFDRIRIRLRGDVGTLLSELSGSRVITGKKSLGFADFQKNMTILEQFSLQQKQDAAPGAAVISPDRANRAWKGLRDQLVSAPDAVEKQIASLPKNSPDRMVLTDYLTFLKESRACFGLAEEHERQVQNMGRTELFAPPADNGLNVRDAQPYLQVLAGSGVCETLESFSGRRMISGTSGLNLGAFSDAVRTLSDAFRAGGTNASEELQQAWKTMKKGAPELLDQITKRLDRMTFSDSGYEDLLRLRTAVTACQEAAERTEARENVRSFRIRTRKIEEDINAIHRELALADELDEEAKQLPEEESSPSELTMRMHLSNLRDYRWNIGQKGDPFEEEFPKLNRKIEQYRSELPEALRARYDRGVTFEELKEDDDRYRAAFNQAHQESVKATGALNRALDKALENSGLSSDQRTAFRNALTRAVTDAAARRSAEQDNGRAVLDKTLETMKNRGAAIPENCAAELRECFDRLVPPFSRAMSEMNRAMGDLNGMNRLWDLKVTEGKRAILVEQNRALYERERDSHLTELQDQPDAKLRRRLKKLNAALGKAHKLGLNSEEYNRFRSALDAAAEHGSLENLSRCAQEYIRAKGDAPTSTSGRARLMIATQVAALLQTSLQYQAHPVIPEEEKDAPLEEVELDPFEMEQPEPEAERPEIADPQEAPFVEVEVDPFEMNLPEEDGPAVFMPAGEKAPEDEGYLLLGNEKTDAFRETTAFFLETRLFDQFGWDEETCRKVADKMLQIMDRNLTGYPEEDRKRMAEEYRKTFIDPGLEGYPRLPQYGDEKDRYLGAMEFFAGEYEHGMTARDKKYDLRMSDVDADSYPNATLEPGSARDDMRLKMAARVEHRLRTAAAFDREFREDIMGVMLDKKTPDSVRNLLVGLSDQNLARLVRSDLRGEALKSTLLRAAQKNAAGANRANEKKIAAVREYRKHSAAEKSGPQ